MSEEEANVAEEIQQQDVVQPEETNHEPPTAPAAEESDKDYNFKQLRESKKQLEDRMARLEAELEEARRAKEQPVEEEDDWGIQDEDLAEGKHLKKLRAEIKSLQKTLQQNELKQIPQRLNSQFPDFDQVVTKENVEKLKNTEPELYASVVSGSDLYAKGVAAYKTLKMLGLADTSHIPAKEQAHKNVSKPLSANAIRGSGPLHEANAFANGLTPELKKQLLKEMTEAAKAR